MMQPSVGRIVHFGVPVYEKLPDGSYGKVTGIEPWAAIISRVHEDDTVNLRGIHPDGYAASDIHREHVKQSETLQEERWCSPPRVS